MTQLPLSWCGQEHCNSQLGQPNWSKEGLAAHLNRSNPEDEWQDPESYAYPLDDQMPIAEDLISERQSLIAVINELSQRVDYNQTLLLAIDLVGKKRKREGALEQIDNGNRRLEGYNRKTIEDNRDNFYNQTYSLIEAYACKWIGEYQKNDNGKDETIIEAIEYIEQIYFIRNRTQRPKIVKELTRAVEVAGNQLKESIEQLAALSEALYDRCWAPPNRVW